MDTLSDSQNFLVYNKNYIYAYLAVENHFTHDAAVVSAYEL